MYYFFVCKLEKGFNEVTRKYWGAIYIQSLDLKRLIVFIVANKISKKCDFKLGSLILHQNAHLIAIYTIIVSK